MERAFIDKMARFLRRPDNWTDARYMTKALITETRLLCKRLACPVPFENIPVPNQT